jgi:hypothetical protein
MAGEGGKREEAGIRLNNDPCTTFLVTYCRQFYLFLPEDKNKDSLPRALVDWLKPKVQAKQEKLLFFVGALFQLCICLDKTEFNDLERNGCQNFSDYGFAGCGLYVLNSILIVRLPPGRNRKELGVWAQTTATASSIFELWRVKHTLACPHVISCRLL